MIETALAAVGLIVFAYLVARIGPWLNTSMVQRNDSFQASRVAAGSTNPGARFNGPSDIHLIGPRAARTGGLGEQPPGRSAAPPTCAAGITQLFQADRARRQAMRLWIDGVFSGTAGRPRVQELHDQVEQLVRHANNAWADALKIETAIIPDIRGYHDSLRSIHNMDLVKRIGGINQLDEAIFLTAFRIGQINTRLEQIRKLLYEDADGPGPVTKGFAELATVTCAGVPSPNAICDPIRARYQALLRERDGGNGVEGLIPEKERMQRQLGDLQRLLQEVDRLRGRKRARLADASELASRWRFTGQSLIGLYNIPSIQGLVNSLSSYQNLHGNYDQAVAARDSNWDNTGVLRDSVEPNFFPRLGNLRDALKALARALYNVARDRVGQAVTIIRQTLIPSGQRIQELLLDAERREELARRVCSSGRD